MDRRTRRTYAVRVDERIKVPDRVSWKRSFDDVRMFGHVDQVIQGFYIVISDNGVRFPIRRGQLTKECG